MLRTVETIKTNLETKRLVALRVCWFSFSFHFFLFSFSVPRSKTAVTNSLGEYPCVPPSLPITLQVLFITHQSYCNSFLDDCCVQYSLTPAIPPMILIFLKHSSNHFFPFLNHSH